MLRNDKWQRETECLDAIALVVGILDHINCITLHAWNETSYNRIWDEATDAQDKAKELHLLLHQKWELLYAAASREARGENDAPANS